MQCKAFSISLGSEQARDQERKVNEFLNQTTVKRVFANLASQPQGSSWSVLLFYEDEGRAIPTTPANKPVQRVSAPNDPPNGSKEESPTLTPRQVKSILALKKWRVDQAEREGVPVYMVGQNRWLEEIVQMPDRTLDDLRQIRGFSEWRVQKYGGKILEILNTVSAAPGTWPVSSYSAGRA